MGRQLSTEKKARMWTETADDVLDMLEIAFSSRNMVECKYCDVLKDVWERCVDRLVMVADGGDGDGGSDGDDFLRLKHQEYHHHHIATTTTSFHPSIVQICVDTTGNLPPLFQSHFLWPLAMLQYLLW